MIRSAFYDGEVMHRRLRPRPHRLRYRIFSLLLDLDEIGDLDRGLRLFSHNRFNLLSFHDRDHGQALDEPLRRQVERHLRLAGLGEAAHRILLLAMPRVFGFMFNPLSIYFCIDREGGLRAIVHEVHNTFGERHSYVLPVTGNRDDIRQSSAKHFHVSPFLPMELDYAFRIRPPGEDVRIAITVSDPQGPVLAAVHAADRRPLTDRTVLKLVAAHGLLGLKVVGAILWEAARLWRKRVPVTRHPPSPQQSATYGPSKRRDAGADVKTQRREAA